MWEIDIANQAATFGLSICLGGLFCALYDIIRTMRKVCLNSFLAVFFTDIVLWIIYAFLTFIFLISRTNGEVRAYVLIGELAGFVLYRISLSRLLFPPFVWIVLKVVNLYATFTRYTARLYIRIETFILKFLHTTVVFLQSGVKSAKKLLKKGCGLLYTNTNNVNTENVLDETKTET